MFIYFHFYGYIPPPQKKIQTTFAGAIFFFFFYNMLVCIAKTCDFSTLFVYQIPAKKLI